jgi:hypothetical protein
MAAEPLNPASVPEAIATVRVRMDESVLIRKVKEIESAPNIDGSTRANLLIQILSVVDDYLRAHPKPQGTPVLNIAPPDGGLAGKAPADVADPQLRAQYEKAIAANKELAEAHSRHDALTALRDTIILHCRTVATNQPERVGDLRTLFRAHNVKDETLNEVLAPKAEASNPRE